MLERMGMIKHEDEEDFAADQNEFPAAPAEAEPAAPAHTAAAAPVAAPAVTPAAAPALPDLEKYTHLSSISGSNAYDWKPVTTTSALGDNFWNDEMSADQATIDQYLEIHQLYEMFHMKAGGVDTVYLLEEYIKTLPDSLPAELRRSIIMRIVQASGFDFDRLLSDGIDRVSKLNDYAAEFAGHTDSVVNQQNGVIAELERQIEMVRGVINERINLHKKQFLTIENEAQRLKEILDFITK
jgi:hypothetical protein